LITGKTVTFTNENDGLRIMRQREPGKRVVGMILIGFDCVWKWAGSRSGLQEVREVGEGWDRWYWRSSVGSWSVGR
jgi:hypothetical protein